MTTSYLSAQTIRDICHSAEGQQEIRAFVKNMDTQGVTPMFIDFKKVEELVHLLVANDYLGGAPANFDPTTYSEKNLKEKFVEFLTIKTENYLCRIRSLNTMEAFHGFPLVKDFLTIYLSGPFKPITFFLWMGQFAVPYREFLETMVMFGHSIGRDYIQKSRKFENMIREAIPLGVASGVDSLNWVAKNQKTFGEIDFSEILSAIPFDNYYSELFEENLNAKKFMNPEFPELGFPSKEKIHLLADEAFKPMILDYVFEKIQSRNLEDINNELRRLFSEQPMLVYQQYSRAIFTVKATEFAKIQNRLLEFLNINNIPYQLVSNDPLDPTFTSQPEGSIPS